jgi:hypothetical protein
MVQHASASKKIVVLETHVQDDQLAATPKEPRRNQLKEALAATDGTRQPTAGIVWGVSRWDEAEWSDGHTAKFFDLVLGDTQRGHKGHAADALLATTALRKADLFVTTDGPLARRAVKAVAQMNSSLEVLTVDQFIQRLALETD